MSDGKIEKHVGEQKAYKTDMLIDFLISFSDFSMSLEISRPESGLVKPIVKNRVGKIEFTQTKNFSERYLAHLKGLITRETICFGKIQVINEHDFQMKL